MKDLQFSAELSGWSLTACVYDNVGAIGSNITATIST